MRMKEVCARTGLTDRAVRLYMESGLISPACERSYSGRASIHFDEADVAALETVATLRRAGFAIADIAAMQADPGCIPAALEARRASLDDEIAERQATRAALGRLDDNALRDVDTLAAGLRRTAPSTSIPKEDTNMSIKEIKQILRVRLAAVLALVASVVGVVNLARLTYTGCFVKLYLKPGGGYERIVDYRLHPVGDVLCAWLPVIFTVIGAILLFCYIARGRRRCLLAAMACTLLGLGLLFVTPADMMQRIRLEEFLRWRESFFANIYWDSNSLVLEYATRVPKHIPFLIALACGIWALIRDRRVD